MSIQDNNIELGAHMNNNLGWFKLFLFLAFIFTTTMFNIRFAKQKVYYRSNNRIHGTAFVKKIITGNIIRIYRIGSRRFLNNTTRTYNYLKKNICFVVKEEDNKHHIYHDKFKAAEEYAKDNKLGIWGKIASNKNHSSPRYCQNFYEFIKIKTSNKQD